MADLEYTDKLVSDDKDTELTINSQGISLSDPRRPGGYIDLTHEEFGRLQDLVAKYYGFAEVIKVNIEV